MVHVFPYWDFNKGQLIDVRACTNAPAVELFFNGQSLGVHRPDHAHGKNLVGHWQIPYRKGEIRAAAMDADGNVLAEEVRRSFGESAKLSLSASADSLKGDGEELLFVEISMEDGEGNPVENAVDRVRIAVEGAGALAGTDNGDSTDTDGYQAASRRLFSGKLLAILKAGIHPGVLRLRVSSENVPDAVLEIPVEAAGARPGSSPLAWLAPACRERGEEPEESGNGYVRREWAEESVAAEDGKEPAPGALPGRSADRRLSARDIPVRKIELSSGSGQRLNPDNSETEITARLCPAHASDQEVVWSIVDDAGIPVGIASLEGGGQKVWVRAKSDGRFRIRCMSRSGTEKIRVISSLEFTAEGFGKAFTDPYEFVSAGQYDYGKGEIGNGNEHGVATARDGESQVGFRNLDFGSYGSDYVMLPIFALTEDPYEIGIYEGMPEEGGEFLGTYTYQKPKQWNVYQEAFFRLPKRLRGITELCFVLKAKVHIKGFRFHKYNRAWQQLPAGECDAVYGDSFRRDGNRIREIGNNVTLIFEQLDFGETGAGEIVICGSTPLEKNTILLKFSDGEKEESRMLEFEGGKREQSFPLGRICGIQTVSFVFLPGSRFDFHRLWFREAEVL